MDRLEFKFAGEADDAGTFTAYAATFGNVDRYGDTILPGAFKRTLKEWKKRGQRIPLLWSHMSSEPIGVVETAEEDAKGLKITGRLILETARGREVHALMKAGAIAALSIGYLALNATPGPNGTRQLKEIELFEISPVVIPADPQATIAAVKAAHAAEPDNPADPGTALEEKATMADTVTAADFAALQERFNALDTKAAGFEAEAKAFKDRADELELKLSRPRNDNTAEPTPERKAFAIYLRQGAETMGAERKDLIAGSGPQGGYLANPEFLSELDRHLVEFSPVRAAARVSTTSAGSVILPKRTGALTGYWVGETEGRTETQPAYGQEEFTVHEIACYVDVSAAMLEDSAFNIEAELAYDFGEEFGRVEGVAFVNGNGVKKPLGFMQSGIGTVANGHATDLKGDGIIGLYHGLPTAYARNAVWGMNRTTMGAVRKLKNPTSGDYLWREPLSEGNPPTILGRPVVEMPDLPDIASGAEPIVFGDFAHFRIFDRSMLSVLRDPYSVATQGLVRFHARRRVAAGTSKPAAFRTLKMEV